MNKFIHFIQETYEKYKMQLPGSKDEKIRKIREEAFSHFIEKGLPSGSDENWRHHPIDQLLNDEYVIQATPAPYRPVEEIFKCQVQNIGTNMFTLLNGWYLHQHAPVTIFPNGIIVGSILAAIEQFPDLVYPHIAKEELPRSGSLVALNQALFYDGLFVYIPDNVKVEHPMQLVNLVDTSDHLLIQNRNLIVLGKNASLSFVHCNDSVRFKKTFINNVTEVSLSENASLNYYKMENKDADSLLVDHLIVNQKRHSHLFSNAITFNAGYVRNEVKVHLDEPFAEAKLYGLYIVDRKQYVDNQVVVDHASEDCKSYQLFKGVIDEEAQANFNGHILVAKDAQRTMAFQTNRNITLTDQARITTKPFLEIYADDVQCSHGATVGQLDDEALFYLRSRGICERNARLLLLYAFANEVVDFIEIESLRQRYTDMVKKRLSGELTLCDQCVLHCSDEKNFTFDIDLSKI